MCLSQFKTHSFAAPRVRKKLSEGKTEELSEWHTLPVVEFKSNLPVDAATFKISGKSRNPKPQKSTCMIVHVRRSAVASACIPVVTLFSSGHSGFSAAGPPATFNFIILDSWVDGLWPVKYTAGTWRLRGFPGEHAYCREVGCSVNCNGFRCKLVHQLSGAGSARQGRCRVVKYVHFGWCDRICDWVIHNRWAVAQDDNSLWMIHTQIPLWPNN